nr:uncharacterized mitochondrial protein AtMg00810-like [Tanacetum cinerariifolium]
SREIGILSFLGAYFIALREDTQHLSMGDFGNGYSRNGQKPGEKRQNQTQNGKDKKDEVNQSRKTKVKPLVNKSQTSESQGGGPDWLFDIDALTRTMNYEPIVAEPVKDYILLSLWTADPPFSQDPKSSHDDGSKPSCDDGKKVHEDPCKEIEYNELPFDPNMPALEDVNIFNFSSDDEDDGELTFFLRLQVKQKKDDIFISQDNYIVEILKKFRFTEVKTASTPMETQKPLLKDEDGEEVDVYMYRSMIGSLMYLTSSKPNIRYLQGQLKLGLWYLKDSPFDLVAYTDIDYAGESLDIKSTTGGYQFLRCRLISW